MNFRGFVGISVSNSAQAMITCSKSFASIRPKPLGSQFKLPLRVVNTKSPTSHTRTYVQNNQSTPRFEDYISPTDLTKYFDKRKDIKILSVEGNIAAGKSTLINEILNLKESSEFELVKEPSERWIKEVNTDTGKNMLQSYYEDQRRNAAMFQVYALLTRVMVLVNAIINTNKKILIIERSPESDRHCFFEVNRALDYINGFDTNIYQLFFNMCESSLNFRPDGYVFLKLTPEECKRRIKQRGVASEQSIPIEYLQMLEDAHSSWITKCKNIITIDVGRLDFKEKQTDLQEVLTKIRNFVIDIQK